MVMDSLNKFHVFWTSLKFRGSYHSTLFEFMPTVAPF